MSSPLAVAKAAYNKAMKSIEAVKLAITMEGVKAWKLYAKLFLDKARQPWEKIINAQVTCTPWEGVYEVMHTKTPLRHGTHSVNMSHLSFNRCFSMM